MDREYYLLEDAAKHLAYSVEDIIYLGSHNKINIGIVVGNGVVLKQVISKENGKTIKEEIGHFPGHTVKLHPHCLRDLEAGKTAEAILGVWFGEPSQDIEILKILNTDTGQPLQLRDSKLIIHTEEIEGFKKSLPTDCDAGAGVQVSTEKTFHRVIVQWLFDLWCENGHPETKVFFRVIKKHKLAKNSPIEDHWGAGSRDGGFRWRVGDLGDDMSYKRLGNIIAEDFKKRVNPPK